VAKIISGAKVMFCLDFNDPSRIKGINELVSASDAKKILIDHHQDPADFADIVISETWRGSVGEMIYVFLNEVFDGSHMDSDIATVLYVAIMTDTGNFRYSSSYPEIFRIAGELVRHNIDKENIFTKVYDTYSEDRMRLMGYCLQNRMVVLKKYNTAYIYLTSAELRKFNYVKGDTEGFVNIPFSIKGIRFTALFIEKRDVIKLSFRSRGKFPVNEFAEKNFSGGGHINAAGGEEKDSMKNSIAKFETLLEEYEKQLCED
jgi:phosphoesterase RecJ-like protein